MALLQPFSIGASPSLLLLLLLLLLPLWRPSFDAESDGIVASPEERRACRATMCIGSRCVGGHWRATVAESRSRHLGHHTSPRRVIAHGSLMGPGPRGTGNWGRGTGDRARSRRRMSGAIEKAGRGRGTTLREWHETVKSWMGSRSPVTMIKAMAISIAIPGRVCSEMGTGYGGQVRSNLGSILTPEWSWIGEKSPKYHRICARG
jgi:hypothetical protein